jgi:hypothetical protein
MRAWRMKLITGVRTIVFVSTPGFAIVVVGG